MVTPNTTFQVAQRVAKAIKDTEGENPHSVALATGIPYQTLLRLLRGDETSPFNIRQLDLIARHLGEPRIDVFLVAA